jgi:hypothetical protein
LGWLMTIRGVGPLALSPEVVMKVYEALRYEERFYFYMGATLILGVYLAVAGFAASLGAQ